MLVFLWHKYNKIHKTSALAVAGRNPCYIYIIHSQEQTTFLAEMKTACLITDWKCSEWFI